MKSSIILPTKAGQICRFLTPLDDENPDDVYMIAEDPSLFDNSDTIYVANLKDIQ